jgi:hypothetical protein
MSAAPYLSDAELELARELYLSGLSWRQTARKLRRSYNTLRRKLGKDISRDKSEADKIRWRSRTPGPRYLSPIGQKTYRKLRDIGYSAHDAVSAVMAAE